jgi:peptide/nickel transport system permease protein
MIPTLFGITVLLFVVLRLAPGDPAAVATAGSLTSDVSSSGNTDMQSAEEKFRERYHLNEPIHIQYWFWITDFVQLDFGNEYGRPHVEILGELGRKLQVTVPLALIATLLAYLIALPLGVFSAVRRGSLTDKLVTLGLFLLYSLPTFWAGLMLVLSFGATGLDWFPVLGLHDQDADQMATWPYIWDTIWHGVLPVATMTYGGVAYLSRQMRVGMLETIQQDYIRTATAKGLDRRTVIFKHAMRNSMIPVITVFATLLPILIGGSVLVESIFSVPGMGLYALEALFRREYNIIMATVTFSAFLTMLGFLMSDILYAVVDPRIAYE